MNQLVERHGNWSIAVFDVDPTAEFDALEWRRETAGPGKGSLGHVASALCVEVLQFAGGLTPRALLGADFTPGGRELVLEVGSSGPMTFGARRECRSQLGGPLVPGLPAEFVEPVIDGFRGMAAGVDRPAGILRVHAAGYDEENSSPHAFAHAGAALLWVVCRKALAPGEAIDGLAKLTAVW